MQRHWSGLFLAGLSIALALSVAVASAGRRSYSTKPLREPVRDAATNAVEFTKFNNWLNANYESAPAERRQALKEHLYSIIDSHVRQLQGRSGTTFPSESDVVLSECYAWATRMGVYGANVVLEKLNALRAQEVSATASLPDSFKLVLDGDLFVLWSSVDSLRVEFPYYFMLGDLRDFQSTNGLRTQMAIISTGFGRHADGKGHSQATIMVVFSPSGTASTFNDFWLEKFGLTAADRAAEQVQRMPTYKRYDGKSKLHTEVVFPKTGTGAMAISYMGLDGTYQWNRPHFEDFLANLLVKSAE